MNVVAKLAAKLSLVEPATALSDKEVAELSRQLVGAAEGVARLLSRLRATHVSAYDYLLNVTIDHGFDFPFLDSLVARANVALAANPDAFYTHLNVRHSLAAAREELLGALADAAPFRAVPRP